ncbi:hypothetical protein Bbelb_309030 [Branchiostoma belcheri]|nr:hypothetical protein Bbelb_309030 [Branchiostoma belcheri]
MSPPRVGMFLGGVCILLRIEHTPTQLELFKLAQNGAQPDCPEPCLEVLSIIVIGGTRHGLGQGLYLHVQNCAQSPGTFWDMHRVSQTVPVHGLGQGTVWDKAQFGMDPACPRT